MRRLTLGGEVIFLAPAPDVARDFTHSQLAQRGNIARPKESLSAIGRFKPPTLSFQLGGATGIESEMKYAGNASSAVAADNGNSGASRIGANISPSAFSFQPCIAPRNRTTGRLSHPVISEAAAMPAMNRRLEMISVIFSEQGDSRFR
jgi:hypothetical protein